MRGWLAQRGVLAASASRGSSGARTLTAAAATQQPTKNSDMSRRLFFN